MPVAKSQWSHRTGGSTARRIPAEHAGIAHRVVNITINLIIVGGVILAVLVELPELGIEFRILFILLAGGKADSNHQAVSASKRIGFLMCLLIW